MNSHFPFPEPEPEPKKEPTPPPVEVEEQYDIPEPPNAIHVAPQTEEEAEKIQEQFEKHEEDWQAKQEKVCLVSRKFFNVFHTKKKCFWPPTVCLASTN